MEKFIGKFLLTIGVVLIFVGYVIYKGIKFPIGRLPGDIFIKRENFVFYFPIVSSIIISIILTIIFSLLFRR
ncbi:MAG: DUF2905 domain-containing protein [Candidatus Omnitrophica bacterium]|nr:DUF2905 domain-containing protein [Candidatus Omnitrophota bacterium]MCM8809030.1 DUF2905 domain-containing protein [Candidatus Omnitrophota bacterium]MCM8810845.1 DUF2905 domain-containing protein [Candidatus Omnitrophota bacterium]